MALEAISARAGLAVYVRWGPAALVAIPAAVYLAAYPHFFLTGHGWAELGDLHRALAELDKGLSRDGFKAQFDQLYAALNGVNKLLLRRPPAGQA